jgi:hypothetical protein
VLLTCAIAKPGISTTMPVSISVRVAIIFVTPVIYLAWAQTMIHNPGPPRRYKHQHHKNRLRPLCCGHHNAPNNSAAALTALCGSAHIG